MGEERHEVILKACDIRREHQFTLPDVELEAQLHALSPDGLQRRRHDAQVPSQEAVVEVEGDQLKPDPVRLKRFEALQHRLDRRREEQRAQGIPLLHARCRRQDVFAEEQLRWPGIDPLSPPRHAGEPLPRGPQGAGAINRVERIPEVELQEALGRVASGSRGPRPGRVDGGIHPGWACDA